MFVKASKPHLFPMAAGSSRPQAILPRFYLLLTVALSLVCHDTSADKAGGDQHVKCNKRHPLRHPHPSIHLSHTHLSHTHPSIHLSHTHSFNP